MHQSIKFILFWNDTRHVRTVFLSIIRSSRLYIQQQAYVKQILLSAWTLDVQDWTCSNRHMSNRYCWLWPSGVQDCTYSNRHMSNRYCLLWPSGVQDCTYSNRRMSNRYCCLWPWGVQDCTYSNRHMSNRYCCLWPSGVQGCSYSNRHMSKRYCCLLDHQEFKTVHTATGICQTDTAVCLNIRCSRLNMQQQAYVKQILLSAWPSGVQDCTYSNRNLWNRCCCLFASKQTAISNQAVSSICLTNACCCMHSLELLMMDGKTVRYMQSVIPK